MAIVRGPLNSLEARGTFAGLVNFQQRGGRSIARRHSQPKGPRTVAQLDVQARTKLVAEAWATLTPEEKGTWLNLTEGLDSFPFNAFFAFNWARLAGGNTLTKVWPPVPPPAITLVIKDNPGDPTDPSIAGDYQTIGTYDGRDCYMRTAGDRWAYWLAGSAVWRVQDAIITKAPNYYYESTADQPLLLQPAMGENRGQALLEFPT